MNTGPAAEKSARLDQLERQVADRTHLLELVHDVTAAANRAATVEEAVDVALRRVAGHTGWPLGHLWRRETDTGDFVSSRVWYEADGAGFAAFRRATRGVRYGARDEGLVPDVARRRAPQWTDDLHTAPRYARGGLGVRALIGFPVLAAGAVEAVLVFGSDRPLQRSARVLVAMETIGLQLGRVIERERHEREMAELADREQRRIGQELHDTLGQQVTGMSMMLRALERRVREGDPRLLAAVEQIATVADEAKAQAARVLKGIMPVEIDAAGLAGALRQLAERTRAAYDVECECECNGDIDVHDRFTATQVYRIAQEAVHNAVRHARADRIVVRLRSRGDAFLTVEDDGVGLPAGAATSGGHGLRIMRHRGRLVGRLSIDDAPGGGTRVRLALSG